MFILFLKCYKNRAILSAPCIPTGTWLHIRLFIMCLVSTVKSCNIICLDETMSTPGCCQKFKTTLEYVQWWCSKMLKNKERILENVAVCLSSNIRMGWGWAAGKSGADHCVKSFCQKELTVFNYPNLFRPGRKFKIENSEKNSFFLLTRYLTHHWLKRRHNYHI